MNAAFTAFILNLFNPCFTLCVYTLFSAIPASTAGKQALIPALNFTTFQLLFKAAENDAYLPVLYILCAPFITLLKS